MSSASAPAYSPFRVGETARAYNESAFRYFLDIEQRRAERSTRTLLLFLVHRRRTPGAPPGFSKALSTSLFAAFGACFREVDIVGWYREQLVAGAVVLINEGGVGDELRQIADRVTAKLVECMGDQARQLRVRVVMLGRKKKN